jgi:hypothetical protein
MLETTKKLACLLSAAALATVLFLSGRAAAAGGWQSVVTCGDGYGTTCAYDDQEATSECTNRAMVECYDGHNGLWSIDYYPMLQ